MKTSLLGLPYDIGSIGPIINLEARFASRIFLFHQRFLLFENVYFSILLLFPRIGVGGGGGGVCPPTPSPYAGPAIKKRLKSAIKFEYISCMDAGTFLVCMFSFQ